MTLRQQQSEFARNLGHLINYAYSLGYEVTIGDVWSKDHYREYGKAHIRIHKAGSKHNDKLAVDLNLFKDGKYLSSTKAHKELGEYWERLGGSWGGRWDDGNHYSWGE